MSVRSHGHHHRTRGARLSRGVLLLFAAAVGLATLGATAAHAAATVTGGHCGPAGANPWAAGACVTGSTLRLAGTGLDSAMTVAIGSTTAEQPPAITCPTPTVNEEKTVLTCTLSFDSADVPDGVYPVVLTLAGTQTSAGNVMIGTFLQQTIPTWNANAAPAQQFTVTGVSSTTPTSGDSWKIQGTFDTAATYEVLFYNTEEEVVAGNNGKTPVCAVTEVEADALTCTITIDVAVMGRWKFLVRDTATQAFLSGSADSFTVNPPAPFVTHITGPCAMDESKCVDGAVLTMVGGNFNYRSPSYNWLILTPRIGMETSFRCDITAVTPTELTCTLNVGKWVTPGKTEQVELQVQVAANERSKRGEYMIGEMVISEVDGTLRAVWNGPETTTTDSFVTGMSGSDLISGDTWVVYGKFHTDRRYTFDFKMQEYASGIGMSRAVPVCTDMKVGDNSITCVLEIENSAMGPFSFEVRDATYNAQLPRSNAGNIRVTPPLPQVTLASGDCTLDSRQCKTGATLTFTGTNFHQGIAPSYNIISFGSTLDAADVPSCTITDATATELLCDLTVRDNVPAGAYPAFVHVRTSYSGAVSPAVRIGTLVVGSFPPHELAGWSTKDLTTTNLHVSGISTTQPATGSSFTAYGTFDPAASYDVMFYTTEPQFADGNNGKTPACTGTTVEANTLKCNMAVDSGVMGEWAFVVRDTNTGSILPGSTSLDTLAVIPPLPTVTGATGACAEDSSKCVTDAELTFTGSNFNPRDASYNRITVGDDEATNDAVQCTPKTVTETTLTCELAVGTDAQRATHSVYAQVQVTGTRWSPSTRVGNLVLATDSTSQKPGWNNDDVVTQNEFVVSVSSARPSTGDAWTIYGRFDTATPYRVHFANTDSSLDEGNAGKTPVCEVTAVASNGLTCTITAEIGVMGAWKLQVQDEETGALLPVPATLPLIAVNPALPTVTGATGACAEDSSKCVTDAELTLTGSNFNPRGPAYNKVTVGSADSGSSCEVTKVDTGSLTCTLSIEQGTTDKALQLAVQVQVGTPDMLSPQQSAGVLMLGADDQQGVAGWHATQPVLEHYAVAGTSSAWPSSGDEWTIFGSFNTAATYTVAFVSAQSAATKAAVSDTPVCKVTAVASNGLTCTITAEIGVMGTWKLQVQDEETGALLPVPATLPLITVNPPLPTVTGATGACAADSSKCVTGAILTLTGSNFNTRSPAYNKVNVGSADSDSSCAVIKVDTSSLTCTLSIKQGTTDKALQLVVQVQVGTADMLSPPQLAGVLVLRGGVGWVDGNIVDGESDWVVVSSAGSSKVWMVLAIVFAISTTLLILATLVLWFCGRTARSRAKFDADNADAVSMDGDLPEYTHAPDAYDASPEKSSCLRKDKASLDARDGTHPRE